MTDQHLWLIRTSKNHIMGPLPRLALCEKIQNGGLVLQDEICPANGYWIYLHESEEVSRHLGILPKPLDSEESTETETETETATATEKIVAAPPHAAPPPHSNSPSHELKPESVSGKHPDRGHPPQMTGSQMHTGSVTGARASNAQRALDLNRSRVESPSFLKGLLFALILGMIVSLICVLRLTRGH
ncbi:MAG: hypothetical protein H7222_18465 [Methylotenera sp.]|nr:hypothetical protein [Oligoflexia bacterium]